MVFLGQNPEKSQKEDQPNKPALWRAQTGIRAGFDPGGWNPNPQQINGGIGGGVENIHQGLTTILEASTEIGDSLVGAR